MPELQPRRDPVLRLDLLHHAPPVGVLAQHELDELGARGEGGEPEAAAAAGDEARGVDRQARRAPAAGRPSGDDRDQPMTPAFATPGSRRRRRRRRRRIRGRARSSRASPLADRARSAGRCAPRLHQIVHPVRRQGCCSEPSVTSKRPSAPALIALTAWNGASAGAASERRRRRRRRRCAPRCRRARPRCRRPAGSAERGDGPVEARDLGVVAAAVEARADRACRRRRGAPAVGWRCPRRLELRRRPRPPRASGSASARRRTIGTVIEASPRPEQPVAEFAQAGDHARLPPAPVVLDEVGVGVRRACSRPMRLFMMPPR